MDMQTLNEALDKSAFLREHIIICGIPSDKKKDKKKSKQTDFIKEEQ